MATGQDLMRIRLEEHGCWLVYCHGCGAFLSGLVADNEEAMCGGLRQMRCGGCDNGYDGHGFVVRFRSHPGNDAGGDDE